MTTLSWNCQGLGLPWKVRFLTELINQENPTFIFLSETLCRKDKMNWIRSKLGFEGMILVEPRGKSGGLALLRREKDQAELCSMSANHIDAVVSVEGLGTWRLTGMYGEPDRSRRRKTWDLLRNLSRDSNLPWCLIEDLNNVVGQGDKQGGEPYPNWLIDGFTEVLNEIELKDMPLIGHQYTWE